MKTLGAKALESLAEVRSNRLMYELEQRPQFQRPEPTAVGQRAVARYFDKAKTSVRHQIGRGSATVATVRLGRDSDGDAPDKSVYTLLVQGSWPLSVHDGIELESHPYHAEWRAFKEWARSEDLVSSFELESAGHMAGSNHMLVLRPI